MQEGEDPATATDLQGLQMVVSEPYRLPDDVITELEQELMEATSDEAAPGDALTPITIDTIDDEPMSEPEAEAPKIDPGVDDK